MPLHPDSEQALSYLLYRCQKSNDKVTIMIQGQKQVLHIENGKSFSRGEANENERRWDDRKIDQLNRDQTNNYDKTRMHLNFEIGSDGKIHPLGYMDKRLDERIQERLDELGYHPFKADSKIQPNICAKLIIGGKP